MDKKNDPRQHIRFTFKGIEYAFNGSPKGSLSIKTFRLNKETLRTNRYRAQKRAVNLFLGAYNHYMISENLSPKESWERARSKLSEFEEGSEEYSAAALDFLFESWDQLLGNTNPANRLNPESDAAQR